MVATARMRDSAVLPCFHDCPAFLHRHFLSQSPPSPPLNPFSSQSTAALALGSLHTPQSPAPSHCAFQGTLIPVQGMYGCCKDYLILIPFRLLQVSYFTVSLKCFSDTDNCSAVGIGTLLQFPIPWRAGSVLLITLVFSPISFLLPSFTWLSVFFSSGQVLLSTLSWCSICTIVSAGVFLMYLWREMYSMSTYSSAILFSIIKI